ncbi:MAG: SufD family Fe-S cluster assembly protein, partial [Actinobacteria bacterium]|nr:SufD family Fe-S cluster assembly protein [Actinomycetota bacterium]
MSDGDAPATLEDLGAGVAAGRSDLGEPPWLATVRAAAGVYVADHGYPTRKDEDWRYVKLKALLDERFSTPDPTPSDIRPGDPTVGPRLDELPDLGGTRIVYVDGRFAPGVSHFVETDGLTVVQLGTAIADGRVGSGEELIGAQPAHTFDALNMALVTAGVQVTVADGAHIAAPVHVVHVLTGAGDPILANLRNPVRIGRGAEATLVVSTVGAPGATGCLNATTRVRLAPGAKLHYRDVQIQPTSAFHLSLVDVTQEAMSTFDGFVAAVGGAIARHEIHVRQVGSHATTHIDGLYIPRGDQQHDHPILIEHFGEGGTSREVYRGVVDGRGHGIFNGQIVIHPDAQRIDAEQSNRNLLLSDTAEVDTRPRLLIYADDVKATHGSS